MMAGLIVQRRIKKKVTKDRQKGKRVQSILFKILKRTRSSGKQANMDKKYSQSILRMTMTIKKKVKKSQMMKRTIMKKKLNHLTYLEVWLGLIDLAVCLN